MAKIFSHSDFREVKPVFTDKSLPPSALEAAIAQIRKIEAKYYENPSAVSNLTAQDVFLVGKRAYESYLFKLTTVMATATYTFDFQKVVNPDGTDLVYLAQGD